jgi:indolepyruvate ferredoxin oxidoreductase alpha subunit
MLVNDQKTKQGLLLGNEAVVRGALEAGVSFVTTYPGTPASEIGDTFAKIAKENKFYFEYSANEKVALEAAAGAAFSGLPAMTVMKHYGLNVALDSFLPLVYLECPMVVVIADDPGSWSSIQAEQDSRWITRLGHVPTLEPADSQEAKDMTIAAFGLAQQYRIPVLIRLTTRICHTRALVDFNKIPAPKDLGNFIKKEFSVGATQTIARHNNLMAKIKKIQEEQANNKFNFIEAGRERKLGLIVSGVSFFYIKEILAQLNLSLPILKIGFSYPTIRNKFKEFLDQVDEILVVEELDPILERDVRRLLQEFGITKKVYGKDLLPSTGELRPEYIREALQKIFNLPLTNNLPDFSSEKIEVRPPTFCAGCPHRATFWMVKKVAGSDQVFGGDIGCYLLGALPPSNMSDFTVSMGAGISISHGVSKATKAKRVVFIGDGTFFHAGIPGLINLVYNQSDILMIILDNRITAMTGHQPNPGSGLTGQGDPTIALKIEDIVRACGVTNLEVINAFNLKESLSKIKNLYQTKGVSVIVSKGECRLLVVRRLTEQGISLPKVQVEPETVDLPELDDFGCPAIRRVDGKYHVDEAVCWSCYFCPQIYPDKIHPHTKLN